VNTRADHYATELIDRRWLSNKSFEITLKKPGAFKFIPGQWIRLTHDAVERDYSLVCAPTDPTLALCIRNIESGKVSVGLSHIPIGTQLKFSGPHGYFTYKSFNRPAVFVATGTGIAPFVSMARSGVTGFTILHGVRSAAEAYYASVFKSTAEHYIPCFSEISQASHACFQGRVTDYLDKNLPSGPYDFYLCGRREMIRDVIICVDQKFPDALVFSEIFY
jgi:ferredoxin-NADP reductase